MTAAASATLSWTHPRAGQVVERLCPSHDGTVLAALRALGIGCTGERYAGPDRCGRCAAEEARVDVRVYLRLPGWAP